MNRMAEVRAVGSVARQLPGALMRRGCHTRLVTAERNARYPVVLVHGYVGSEAVWAPLRAALSAAGFGYLVSLDYSCFDTEAAQVSAELVRQTRRALARTGAPRVHLVGHSMGGLIVRRTVTSELADVTATAVTIATPHRGAPLGRIAPGRCARIMHRPEPAQPCAGRPAALARVLLRPRPARAGRVGAAGRRRLRRGRTCSSPAAGTSRSAATND